MEEKMTKDMVKTEMTIEKACCVKEECLGWLKEHISQMGESISPEDCMTVAKIAGMMADICKDAREEQKLEAEACYYETVTEAMKEADVYDPEEGPYGYNHRHTMSGRFASKGRGHIVGGNGSSGYSKMPWKPGVSQEPYVHRMLKDPEGFYDDMMDDRPDANYRMGYRDGMNSNMGRTPDNRSRRGESYDNYQDARRNYTETHNLHDKDQMNTHINHYVSDFVTSGKEMWKDADPETRKAMKTAVTALVADWKD